MMQRIAKEIFLNITQNCLASIILLCHCKWYSHICCEHTLSIEYEAILCHQSFVRHICLMDWIHIDTPDGARSGSITLNMYNITFMGIWRIIDLRCKKLKRGKEEGFCFNTSSGSIRRFKRILAWNYFEILILNMFCEHLTILLMFWGISLLQFPLSMRRDPWNYFIYYKIILLQITDFTSNYWFYVIWTSSLLRHGACIGKNSVIGQVFQPLAL